MRKLNAIRTVVSMGSAALLVASATGCKELPGNPKQQGATIGGLGGAAAGAAIAKDNRLLGALIGGAIGAGGGYLIGANSDRISGKDRKSAEEAVSRAQTNPATAEQAKAATTGDINNDGFVTMDEVVALEKADFTDEQILERLRATGQVFELTSEQQTFLRNNGVSQDVIDQMSDLNREVKDRLLSSQPNQGVIGRPANTVGE